MRKPQIDCATLFLEEMSRYLGDPVLHVARVAQNYKRIEGSLSGTGYRTHVDILFSPEYFKKVAPIVFCDDFWIRKDINWHCFKAGGIEGWEDRYRLCWLHPNEWRAANDYQLKRLPFIIEEGSQWLCNNVTKLLDRHWVGNQLGLTTWREEWGGWGHGETGNQEFLGEIKQQGHPKNWAIQETNENKTN
jgi:hypothetical protein